MCNFSVDFLFIVEKAAAAAEPRVSGAATQPPAWRGKKSPDSEQQHPVELAIGTENTIEKFK